MLAEKGRWAFWEKTCLKPCVGICVCRTEVPFAELSGGIAGFLQAGGNGGFLVKAREVLAIVIHVEAALKLADHQTGTRGHALRSGAIAMLGQHAALGERIDVRSLDVGDDTLNSEIGVTVVVGVDDDDVGLGCVSNSRKEKQERKNWQVFHSLDIIVVY